MKSECVWAPPSLTCLCSCVTPHTGWLEHIVFLPRDVWHEAFLKNYIHVSSFPFELHYHACSYLVSLTLTQSAATSLFSWILPETMMTDSHLNASVSLCLCEHFLCRQRVLIMLSVNFWYWSIFPACDSSDIRTDFWTTRSCTDIPSFVFSSVTRDVYWIWDGAGRAVLTFVLLHVLPFFCRL